MFLAYKKHLMRQYSPSFFYFLFFGFCVWHFGGGVVAFKLELNSVSHWRCEGGGEYNRNKKMQVDIQRLLKGTRWGSVWRPSGSFWSHWRSQNVFGGVWILSGFKSWQSFTSRSAPELLEWTHALLFSQSCCRQCENWLPQYFLRLGHREIVADLCVSCHRRCLTWCLSKRAGIREMWSTQSRVKSSEAAGLFVVDLAAFYLIKRHCLAFNEVHLIFNRRQRSLFEGSQSKEWLMWGSKTHRETDKWKKKIIFVQMLIVTLSFNCI